MTKHDEAGADGEHHGAPEDIKEKFREALERKKGLTHPHAEGAHGESKAHGEHGKADVRQDFRRKSG